MPFELQDNGKIQLWQDNDTDENLVMIDCAEDDDGMIQIEWIASDLQNRTFPQIMTVSKEDAYAFASALMDITEPSSACCVCGSEDCDQ